MVAGLCEVSGCSSSPTYKRCGGEGHCGRRCRLLLDEIERSLQCQSEADPRLETATIAVARSLSKPAGPHSSLPFVKFHDSLSTMFREILSSSAVAGREGKWETRSVFQGGCAAVFSSLRGGDRNPSRHDGRAVDGGFEFPDQGVAVIDLQALFDPEDLDPLPGQSATDAPLGIGDVQLALAVDLQHPGALRVMPARRVGIVTPWAGTPATGWGLHAQGLVRTQVVVLPAITVQPMLGRLPTQSAPGERTFERAVKALHLALCLRMSDAAPMQPYALLHQPQRQSRSRRLRSGPTPPRHAVIHQHGLRNTALDKRLLQPRAHRSSLRAAQCLQRDQVTAVVIQYRERSDRLVPRLRSLEIHLPQLVGRGSLEASLCRTMPVMLVHQLAAKQDAMNGARRQLNATRTQQYLKLARAPVGIAQAQLDHPLFQLRRRLPGTVQRPPTAFGNRFDSAGTIPLDP